MNFLKSQKLKVVVGALGLYLLSTGISWSAFSFLKGEPDSFISPDGLEEKRGGIDLSGPKNEECPLNGKKYTKTEKNIWEARRPLGIMVENHEEARPQSGLSRADIVYEAIAEGGITRFLAIYLCDAAREEVQVGPVRSARTYYLDWISEYGEFPLYAHVGGANTPGPANALGQIASYGWNAKNDLNQFSIGFPTFWRDYERLGHPVATEHTMYSTTDKLWEVAAERGFSSRGEDGEHWDKVFVPWRFKDPKPESTPTASSVTFPFWEGYSQYGVSWKYDESLNVYKRENGGSIHTDLNNNQRLEAANVVVMFTTVKGPIDALKHLLYKTIGKGEALIFQDGQVIKATWSKESRTSRTKFTGSKGAEIEFVRGPVWIEVLQTGTKVNY